MARRRKNKFNVRPYEKRPGGLTGFVRLFYDVLDSPAFQDLTPTQQRLYLYCRRESHGLATAECNDHDECLFYMNHALRVKKHKLYSETNTRGFERDMAALVEHGFVDCIEPNYKSRRKNLYRLSSRWHHWGTDAFSLPDSVLTTHMRIERAKQERPQIRPDPTQ